MIDELSMYERFERLGIYKVIVKCLPNDLLYLNSKRIIANRFLNERYIYYFTNCPRYLALREIKKKIHGAGYPLFEGAWSQNVRHIKNNIIFEKIGWDESLVIWTPCGKRWFVGFIFPPENGTCLSNTFRSRQRELLDICSSVSLDIYHHEGRNASPYYRCRVITKSQQEALDLIALHGMN